jgi:hypothetical protein
MISRLTDKIRDEKNDFEKDNDEEFDELKVKYESSSEEESEKS